MSLLAFSTASYAAQSLAALLSMPNLIEEKMVMTSALVIMCLGNFVYLSIRANAQRAACYVQVSIGILLLYAFLAHTTWTFFPINAIKTFYEIENFRPELWLAIALSSAGGLLLLWLLHGLVERWLLWRAEQKRA
ncbi:MAG: hypothetical protein RML35_13480 [Chloroherpetonaceae bacterium]|nr:hypothetical protein [Chloroherpetonaceae bacterium]